MEEEPNLIWINEHYRKHDGSESNLFVSARDLARWGSLHLNKGRIDGKQFLPEQIFTQTTSIISPPLHEDEPRNGYFWFVQDKGRAWSEIGDELPPGTFQSLGITGCTCLVIPERKIVAVRMFNQVGPNPSGYNYLQDIKAFGHLVYSLTS